VLCTDVDGMRLDHAIGHVLEKIGGGGAIR